MRRYLVPVIALATLLASSGCAPMSATPQVELQGKPYRVEIAETHEQRARGLMFRRDLPADAGMLFIHDEDEILSYWMKNTYIALDILYFDRDLRLVSAHLDVPPCGEQPQCPNYPSAGPARYVLELNAGEAGRMNLKVGDKLRVDGLKNRDKADE
jgi:uncharacterized membrane protein (UPF0127 family)